MAANWYYVLDNERVGPVSQEELEKLFSEGTLFEESFVWQKGFDNWKHIQDVPALEYLYKKEIAPEVKRDVPVEKKLATEKNIDNKFSEDLTLHLEESEDSDDYAAAPEKIEHKKDEVVEFNWATVSFDDRIFTIKTGIDRNGVENEYGPYALNFIKKLFEEKRINGKTLIFSPGMTAWIFLADTPIYEKLFAALPPIIDEVDRRKSTRRPFVARLLFHDQTKVYEGICRDISIGGLQILVADCPLVLGNTISMNVHPDNGERSFVAQGKIVRVLTDSLGFSLRFVGLNEEARKSIEEYINQN
ncbi:MAG: hypothetical protein A2504_14240 [Bdellovibrionales bacterium RIFOXYD12_FULL_39_22]|nr:MAG: hypothetical protein A2385_04675 [Bdellovibrionales bacterium RIFOXYB1_FULL_39_21]OFZ43442.1 MAG: hypothetical protein A2485_13190 [Bdellovibrionales bacterium RIFOXYC12_FULL_39_17]OFZ46985.1 MAG: hypothetical protein A2404_00250 [Bdellovibrionales bacterium RIFOXYC1_FULL_39_130]OFZ72959.1 MAG: hypothetical protein A2451_07320 [Bdellovibrionales bacterium RIFOXYC2_FULL_39_8]OFZ76182.1 MAG: hypothetical protein A2560_07500 [Bdellovibrionales bacterium RIFOXYD1_FULL_39_84]OFZ94417.1 MAG: